MHMCVFNKKMYVNMKLYDFQSVSLNIFESFHRKQGNTHTKIQELTECEWIWKKIIEERG